MEIGEEEFHDLKSITRMGARKYQRISFIKKETDQ